jgi:DNA processing protein
MTTTTFAPGDRDELLRAAAYLSRVAEPACLPLWELVCSIGYLDAARAVAAGDVPDAVRTATQSRRTSVDPDADLEAATALGIRVVTPLDDDWPHLAMASLVNAARDLSAERRRGVRRERERPDPVPPIALWVRGPGDLGSLGVRSIGIVGARAATGYGQHVASELAFGVAERGVTVVSGGAFGIDAAAHRGALAGGGSTVLVSAAGLDRPYPAAHSSLYSAVADSGLLLSERPPGSAPHRQRFLSRNRLIAALGAATVLVEAAGRSGALNTAGYCRDLEKPLLAVPGPVTSAMSAGCHRELQRDDGPAHLVTSVADLMRWVNPAAAVATVDVGPISARDQLTMQERAVLDGFPPRGAVSESELANLSGQPIQIVLAALPTLLSHEFVASTRDGFRLVVKSPVRPRMALASSPQSVRSGVAR